MPLQLEQPRTHRHYSPLSSCLQAAQLRGRPPLHLTFASITLILFSTPIILDNSLNCKFKNNNIQIPVIFVVSFAAERHGKLSQILRGNPEDYPGIGVLLRLNPHSSTKLFGNKVGFGQTKPASVALFMQDIGGAHTEIYHTLNTI